MLFSSNYCNDTTRFKPLRAADSRRRASPLFFLAGSMTVEAALAIPLFLFFMMNIIWLLEMTRIESCMRAALVQTGEQICEYAFYTKYGLSSSGGDLPEMDGIGSADVSSFALTQTYVRSRLQANLKASGVDMSEIQGGAAGISLVGSRIMVDGGEVYLKAVYRVRHLIGIPGRFGLKLITVYFGHAWVGYIPGEWTPSKDEQEEDTTPVYVARYGAVYHTDPGCIYLNPQTRTVSFDELVNLRSGDGSIYYACEECHPSGAGNVIITKEGNRYHSDMSCGGIHRTVRTMTASDASSHYRNCPKCAGGH